MNKFICLQTCRKRRHLLAAGLSLSAIALPGVTHAQTRPPVVIGWLSTLRRQSSYSQLNAFHEGMSERGWTLGKQYVLEERWLNGQMASLQAVAGELATKKPQVIVAGNSAAVKAAATAAPHTPIVLISGNVLEAGLVKSLAHPGGMITGMANFQVELIGKHVDLLLQAMPKLRRIGFLIDPKTLAIAAFRDASQKAARRFSLGASFGEAGSSGELDAVLNQMAKEGAQAIVVTPSAWFPNHVQSIMQFAFAHRMPVVVAPSYAFPEAGALIAYGGDLLAQIRRTSYFVDRILKGAKPGDLPIEQPTKFELVINLKTAKALGLTIPPSVLVQATRVIE